MPGDSLHKIDAGKYHVFIGENALRELASMIDDHEKTRGKVFILVDEQSRQFCLPLLEEVCGRSFQDNVFEVTSGEIHKNIHTCMTLWESLNSAGADRKALLVNLGGGVIGDMGGFVASTYKRGFEFIQVPTTLLSQVDASVGGKLGVDLDLYKNLIGVFNEPKGVFIFPAFLKTLPLRQLYSGFAEVIKHGLIYDKAYYKVIADIAPEVMAQRDELLAHSVSIKNDVVSRDPFEKGLRKILNFGHTLGHAIESWSLKHDADPLLHGEAIAIGMICEGFLSLDHGLKQDDLEMFATKLNSLFPAYDLSAIPIEALMEIMMQDKKNEGGKILFSLLSDLGTCIYDVEVTPDKIGEAISYYEQIIRQLS
ncbi:MAG: 3-dehydroquinate synthase [Flavobacteriales bacterium]|nr:3-dehydroquinate synthase [Flavobacteriales bacterium]